MAIALALSVTAITRASVHDELDRDVIVFARARGIGRGGIVVHDLLRNALVPVVTAASVIVVAIMAGSIYTEITVALPGLGTLLVDAVGQRDIPLIQEATPASSVFVILVNIGTDMIHAVIDRRSASERPPDDPDDPRSGGGRPAKPVAVPGSPWAAWSPSRSARSWARRSRWTRPTSSGFRSAIPRPRPSSAPDPTPAGAKSSRA